MTATSLYRRFEAALLAPVDPASLVVFRVAFGALMLVAVLRFFAHGWISEYFIEPKHFFPYHGLEWIRPWPGAGMYVHFALMGVLAVMIATGTFYRVSMALFGAAFAYAHLIDKTNYLNHYYLLICLSALMVALPLHRAGSVDAWLRPQLRASAVPSWVLWSLRAQVGLVYIFGGIAKLKSDWLVHAQPMKIWLAASTDFPLVGRLFEDAWVAYAFSYAGAAFDLSIVGFLLWPRSRPFAYVAVVVFHLITARLFQLGMFPWVMIVSTLIFFPPDWPRRWWAAFKAPDDSQLTAASAATNHSRARPTLALVGLYFALQYLLPFRHLLYPGDVNWTEEGFRFSWNVMLMEKDGAADFRVTEPSTGRQWVVPPTDYLTRYQTKMMSSQPDMILAFAHVLAKDFRARGVRDPEVRVDAFASLNGRPLARLIDPQVNLAEENDSFSPKRWILAAAEGMPP